MTLTKNQLCYPSRTNHDLLNKKCNYSMEVRSQMNRIEESAKLLFHSLISVL